MIESNTPARKQQNILFAISLSAIFISIYILNVLYPLHAEDWDYSFLWIPSGDSSHRVNGISDILISQYNHYMHWGGRSIIHAIDQILLLLGDGWQNLLNSFVFTLFVFIIYKISNPEGVKKSIVLIALFLLLWFFQPAFSATVLWITGSANYLWGTFIIVLFIYSYYKYYIKGGVKDGMLRSGFFFLGGIIAGWTNENMSLALISFIIILLILLKYKQVKIPRWFIFGLLGAIIGCGILLLAPGNYVRIENSRSSDFDLLVQTINMAKMYKRYMLLLVIVYICLSFVFLRRGNAEKYKTYWGSLLFFISAHIGFFAMFASPEFPPRAAFGTISLTIIAIGILYANIDLKEVWVRRFNLFIVSILFILFSFQYYQRYTYLKYVSDFWSQRELFVLDQKEKEIKDIIFTDRFQTNGHFELYEFPDDTNEWFNRVYARYYGVKSVKTTTTTRD